MRLVLVSHEQLVRHALADTLDRTAGVAVVGEATVATEALALLSVTDPNVVLIEAQLPHGSAEQLCRSIRAARPETFCLMLTAGRDDETALTAMRAGASGYVEKTATAAELVDALKEVAKGRVLMHPETIAELVERARRGSPTERRLARLSVREREVLTLISEGLTNREIAEKLSLAEKTVKNYVSHVLHKFELQRRTQAAVLLAEARFENSDF